MKNVLWLGICLLMACQEKLPGDLELEVIPRPEIVNFDSGIFCLSRETCIDDDGNQEIQTCAGFLDTIFRERVDYTLREGKRADNVIHLTVDSALAGSSAEGYRLQITQEKISLVGGGIAGLFYGIQTLGQLLNDARFFDAREKCWHLPALRIADHPAFPYRGLHLDVSRHFFPKEFILKCIDWMAVYKLNRLHWHLTDAAGWRVEIKRYPELTEQAAWRSEKNYLKWWKGDRRYVTEDAIGSYGGFYTQEEIREVVAYAARRQITIIPEIEMPGHSEEVLAVFPLLGCTGEPYRNGEFCIGKEETFRFMENVLTEVLELFPSEYIHIGGDEASVAAWKKCPRCQQRMKKEHLKNEQELQSYMIRRIAGFLQERGRKLIGWDEMLDGGLVPGAAVMSWRGEAGGVRAARMGHDVVMTPGTYCYFDSYQADPETQPYAIGGFTPYLKVYAYHPVPEGLTFEESRHILGAQANVWTEYIETPEHAEYMIFPRLLALAEVVWSPREKRDQEDFKRRIENHIHRLRQKGVNAFTLSDQVDILTEVDTVERRIKVWLDSEKYRPEIRFTINDGEETVYREPFYVTDPVRIKAFVVSKEGRQGEITDNRIGFHKAIGRKVNYQTCYNGSYPAAGDRTLTDGYRGGLTYSDGHWQGFLTDIDVVIDLDTVRSVHEVSAGFMQLIGPGVYMPDYITVSISSDGKDFREMARIVNTVPVGQEELVIRDFTARFAATARYVRLFAKKHAGFQFIDEVVIY